MNSRFMKSLETTAGQKKITLASQFEEVEDT